MPQHFKIHELLNASELEALEAFAREPGRTVDEVHEWLQARGFTMSRSSAGRWLSQFLLEDKLRKAAEVSRTYIESAKAMGVEQIASASMLKFQQLVFEYLLNADEADAGELMKLSIAMKTSLNAEQLIREMKAVQAKALDEAAKAAKGGASGEDVVNKVRQILGIAA